jgi:L,D-transpeptidase ErfK/SrfK
MKRMGKTLSAIFLIAISSNVFATAYNVPPPSESLIGQIENSSVGFGEKATTVTQRYDIGLNALEKANPHININKGLPYGAPLRVPTQHLLPNQAREGIVINLPEMRMYYYLPGSGKVLTYPIGIGKIGKTIPIRKAVITRKKVNPTWIPPDDIREFNLEKGIVLPRIMPPGPDNPLGPYAIYMSIPTYLIHSTPFPESIGTRASFGCIRMYESDIQTFFPTITGGIPLVIINSPTKVGWQNEKLYMETHTPLEEHGTASDASLPGMVHLASEATKNQPTLVDWQLIAFMAKDRDGLPHEIGMKIP